MTSSRLIIRCTAICLIHLNLTGSLSLPAKTGRKSLASKDMFKRAEETCKFSTAVNALLDNTARHSVWRKPNSICLRKRPAFFKVFGTISILFFSILFYSRMRPSTAGSSPMSSLQRRFGLPTYLTPFICHSVLLLVHLLSLTRAMRPAHFNFKLVTYWTMSVTLVLCIIMVSLIQSFSLTLNIFSFSWLVGLFQVSLLIFYGRQCLESICHCW